MVRLELPPQVYSWVHTRREMMENRNCRRGWGVRLRLSRGSGPSRPLPSRHLPCQGGFHVRHPSWIKQVRGGGEVKAMDSVVDPDRHGSALNWLFRIRIHVGMRIRIQDQENLPKLTNLNLNSSLSKRLLYLRRYEVHPKSKWKMWIKREWLQLGGYFFWNFSRHPLLIWLHCFFHHCKTLKAVATATAAIVLLTPANFYHFRRPKFNFQPLWDLWQKTCRNKNCC